MPENRLVTAIITTCQREPQTVKRAIDSVLNQTYENIELIIVDDSPKEYELRSEVARMINGIKNVCYVPLEKNMGACAARNRGIEMAAGDFVAFLDDDDEWLPQKIEKQLEAFNHYGEKTALVYCGSLTVNDLNGTQKERTTRFLSGEVFDELIKENFIGSTSFPLIRTASLREVGGFDVCMEAAQDGDVWLRIAENHEIGYVEDILVKYHIHEGGQITSNPGKRIAGLERLNMKNAEYLNCHREAKWIRQIKLAPCYALAGDFPTAIKKWLSAVSTCPLKLRKNIKYFLIVLRNYRRKHLRSRCRIC